MKMTERDRRDWSLLVFIVPLGILLMLIAGQLALRIIPQWILNTGMGSSLEVETAGGQRTFIQPIFNIQILTPFAWQNTYLTPNSSDGFVFPPFVVLEPSATPLSTPIVVVSSPTEATPPPIATTVTPSPSATVVVTTPPPPTSTDPSPQTCQDSAATNNGGPLPCVYPPTTCTDPAATNNGGPLPCVYPPTTCTDPAATNNGGPLPCVYPPTLCTDPAATNNGGPLPCVYPPTICTDPAATNNGGPLPCVYPPTTCTDPAATNNGGPLPCVYPPPPVVSTLPSGYTQNLPPSQLGVGTLPDNTTPGNDANIGAIPDGTYIVINLGVTVNATPDNNYDLVFYEYNINGEVALDWIIIGLSVYSDGHEYYEVFNWSNGTPDLNSNVGDVAQTTGTETDNQIIPVSDNSEVPVLPPETVLYDPDYNSVPSETNGPLPQTGVLIDVDNAAGHPPAGPTGSTVYNYVVIISPIGGSGQNAQIDSIQATEVPIPTP